MAGAARGGTSARQIPVFVGRAVELGQLASCLEAARLGRPQVVLVESRFIRVLEAVLAAVPTETG